MNVNGKKILIEAISWVAIKENDGGGELKYDLFDKL
jgi:hypothetical protein